MDDDDDIEIEHMVILTVCTQYFDETFGSIMLHNLV
jgi:hypothetical protein